MAKKTGARLSSKKTSKKSKSGRAAATSKKAKKATAKKKKPASQSLKKVKKAKKTAAKAPKKAKSAKPKKAVKTAKATGKAKTAKKAPAKAKKPKTAAKAKSSAKAAKKPKAAGKPKKAAAPKLVKGLTPSVGSLAPAFDLATDQGHRASLQNLRGKTVVLYFYPKADTPGCTKEACDFQSHLPHFAKLEAEVIGVSPDDTTALAKFRSKYNLQFPLAADPGAEVAKRYGVWGEKTLYGKTVLGIQRATFVIDGNGRIVAAWPRVSVEGHGAEVLEAVRGAAGQGEHDDDHASASGSRLVHHEEPVHYHAQNEELDDDDDQLGGGAAGDSDDDEQE